MGLSPHPDLQQVLETPAAVDTGSSSSFGEPEPPVKKVCTKGCLPPSARYAHVGCCTLLCNLSIFVSELRIRWSLSKKRTLGTLNFRRSVPRPALPTSSSPSETVRVEVLRVAYVEEMVPGSPGWEKTVEALAMMRVVGANVSPCTDGGCANGVEPQPKDAPSRAVLTPETSNGLGLSPSHESTLDDVTSVPGSFDIVDLGTGESELPGYPRAPLLPTSFGASGGGAELTRLRDTTVCRLLKEMVTMVGRDIVQLARINY
jgi:hypothetical protein